MQIDAVKQKVKKCCAILLNYKNSEMRDIIQSDLQNLPSFVQNVILASASGTYLVCVCTIHQNVKLLVETCSLQRDFQEIISDHTKKIIYKNLLSLLSCNPAIPDCFLKQCQLCKSTVQPIPCKYCSG